MPSPVVTSADAGNLRDAKWAAVFGKDPGSSYYCPYLFAKAVRGSLNVWILSKTLKSWPSYSKVNNLEGVIALVSTSSLVGVSTDRDIRHIRKSAER